MSTPPLSHLTVYTVVSNGPATLFATADLDVATKFAQRHADGDLQKFPGMATPHYVIQAWGPDAPPSIHVYATRTP